MNQAIAGRDDFGKGNKANGCDYMVQVTFNLFIRDGPEAE